jgi:hypothetical protein
MSKTLNYLRGKFIPKHVEERMEKSEPGLLSHALGEMVYARSHDKEMHSVFPEEVYLGACDDYMAKEIGAYAKGSPPYFYIKTDMVLAKTIALLDAYSLKDAL